MHARICLTLVLAAVVAGAVSSQTALFNGADLTGWQVEPAKRAQHWSVAAGTIVGDNPDKAGSLLWTARTYADYDLTCEYRTASADYDSGVFVRGKSHQVQIGISRSLRRDLTGCLYCPSDKLGGYPVQSKRVAAVHRPGTWNRLRIRVVGRRIQTWLNGERMVDYLGATIPLRGRIGLQLHAGVHQKMEFRGLELTAIEAGRHPAIWADGFETDRAMANWHPTQADRWRVSDTKSKRGKALHLLGASRKYKPPHRSPLSIALLKHQVVGDFVLTARVKTLQTTRGHRDMCIFFGWQDPAHFYYVHLGEKPDPHSSQIFIVDGAPRTAITTRNAGGIPWRDGHWHAVKVVRRVAEGTIEVYFDDMETPAKVAQSRKFAWGLIGLGSFDDLGMWDDVRVDGVRVSGKRVVLPGTKAKKAEKAKQAGKGQRKLR